MQTTNNYLLVTYQLPTTYQESGHARTAGADLNPTVGCFWPVNRTVEKTILNRTVHTRAGVNRIVEEPVVNKE